MADLVVECLADKGTMKASECLACAARGDNVCGFDYALLRYIYQTQEDRSQAIHVTDLTGCLRRAYFSKLYPPVVRADRGIIVSMGKVLHGLLEGDDEVVRSEVRVEGLGVVGRTDLVYHKGRVVDWKTGRGLKPRYLPHKEHVVQVRWYAALLESPNLPITSAAIQYIDLDGPSKCPECKAYVERIDGKLRCPLCNRIVPGAHRGAVLCEVELGDLNGARDDLVKRERLLSGALGLNELPDAEPDFLCRYCPFLNWCEEGAVSVGLRQ